MFDSLSTEYDIQIKVLLLGDSGSGKSSLVLRYAEGDFRENFVSSIGVDFKTRKVWRDKKKIKVQIWDTAGHERFRAITNNYYRGSDAILILFDLTNRESFTHINEWIKQIEKNTNEKVIRFLVGNKNDLEIRRVISTKEALDFAREHNMPYYETSAKSGNNVEQLFDLIITTFIAKNELGISKNFTLEHTQSSCGKCC